MCRHRYVHSVNPKLYYSFSISKAEQPNTYGSDLYSGLSAFKKLVLENMIRVPTSWWKLTAGFPCFSLALSLFLSRTFTGLHESLLKKPKPAQISTRLILKMGAAGPWGILLNQSCTTTFIGRVDSWLVFSFFLISQNAITFIPPSGLPGDLVMSYLATTCYLVIYLYVENKEMEDRWDCVTWF